MTAVFGWLGAAVAAVALLIAVWKTILRPAYRAANWLEKSAPVLADISDIVTELRTDVSSLGTSVAGVKKELHPNGGSSLRDAIDVSARRLEQNEASQAALHRRLDRVEAWQAEIGQYLHVRFHDQTSHIAAVNARIETVAAHVDRIDRQRVP